MSIRVPNLAVLLMALGVSALAVYKRNAAVASVCLAIAAFYAALMLWQWKRRRKNR